jgi:parvulin-like peptidyl-prolyl isomerase
MDRAREGRPTRRIRTRLRRAGDLGRAGAAIGAALQLASVPATALGAETPGAGAADTLALVNGDAITTADVDALIVDAHRTTDMTGLQGADLERFLTKAINDRLILQEAERLGLEEDEALQRTLAEARVQDAVGRYAADTFQAPSSVDETAVREYFDRHYWKIRLRQLSVRTEAEALAIRRDILSGAPMDSLASAISLDTHRFKGGLHNLKYWADVENTLRGPAQALGVGELSEPFPYREAFSLLRVEERTAVDAAAFPAVEAGIRAHLLAEGKKAAWREFVGVLHRHTPVRADGAVLAAIFADSTVAVRGEFMGASDAPALTVDGGHLVTEAELRRAISRAVMQGGGRTFRALAQEAVDSAADRLVLRAAAEAAGYLDRPEVVQGHERRRRDKLLGAFLNELIVPRIAFQRTEFEEYYDAHKDEFRGAEEVQLSTLLIESEAEAKEIESRLAGGADFGYLKRRHASSGDASAGDSRWTAVEVFADAIREEIARMRVGETSRALPIATGWLIFKLDGRRPGEVKSLDEVEMQIRQVMFQRKFNEELDRYLDLLREGSEIVLMQAKIDRYFGRGS